MNSLGPRKEPCGPPLVKFNPDIIWTRLSVLFPLTWPGRLEIRSQLEGVYSRRLVAHRPVSRQERRETLRDRNTNNVDERSDTSMKVLTCLTVAILVAGSQGCEVGWEEIQGSCFAFYQTVSMSWHDARIFCQDLGADLAKVGEANTLRDMYKYITTYGLSGSFWVGATDETVEDDWVWAIDETRVDAGTPFWALHSGLFGYDHEPSGGTDENCLAMDSGRKYYFNDASCTKGYHPICVKPL
ncbi:perlucin-like isoform X2 [Panulirus ornatus]|uniref:perlucin-like isoform X2 n=1 Tax=Panulirus ornatus TaxID=150431 RepID=UPI003A897FE5